MPEQDLAPILEAIPHRPPFLFVDGISTCTSEGIQTYWTPKKEAIFFQGHYPNRPLTPGVLLCEAIFQTSGIYTYYHLSEFRGHFPILARIQQTRFLQKVLPEEKILMEVSLIEKITSFVLFKGKTKKEDQSRVLQVEFTVTFS